MSRFFKRINKKTNRKYKKVITRRKKNRFTRKNGLKDELKNRIKNGLKYEGGGSGTTLVVNKNEPLVWIFKTN